MTTKWESIPILLRIHPTEEIGEGVSTPHRTDDCWRNFLGESQAVIFPKPRHHCVFANDRWTTGGITPDLVESVPRCTDKSFAQRIGDEASDDAFGSNDEGVFRNNGIVNV